MDDLGLLRRERAGTGNGPRGVVSDSAACRLTPAHRRSSFAKLRRAGRSEWSDAKARRDASGCARDRGTVAPGEGRGGEEEGVGVGGFPALAW